MLRIFWDAFLALAMASLFLAYDRAIAADLCTDPIHAMLTPDHVVAELTPSEENQRFVEKIARDTLNEQNESLSQNLKDAATSPACVGDPQACIVRATEEALDPQSKSSKNFLQNLFGKSCLVSGGAGVEAAANAALIVNNRSALAMSLVVGLGGIGAGYFETWRGDHDVEFPYAIVAGSVMSTLLRSEIACRNMVRGLKTPPAGSAATEVSWGRTAMANYLAYGVWVVPSAGIYVGLLMTGDLIRGKEVFTKEQLEKYAVDAGVSMVWDLGNNAFQVVYLDKFFLAQLPAGRVALAKLLEKRVFVGSLKALGDKKVLLIYGNDMPGFFADFGIRFVNSAVHSYGYLKLSDVMHTHLDPDKK